MPALVMLAGLWLLLGGFTAARRSVPGPKFGQAHGNRSTWSLVMASSCSGAQRLSRPETDRLDQFVGAVDVEVGRLDVPAPAAAGQPERFAGPARQLGAAVRSAMHSLARREALTRGIGPVSRDWAWPLWSPGRRGW